MQIGATAFATDAQTQDFHLRSGGASIALYDRFEVSVARQRFDASSVLPGLTLGQDIVGFKLRLAGDAVFAPDHWLPQLAAGAQYKHTLDYDQVPLTLGAAHGADVEYYVAATKVYFDAIDGRNLIVDVTLRRSRANQFGLLGFGGDGGGYHTLPEGSAAVWVTDAVLLGCEYRDKRGDLSRLPEDSAQDAFVAWAPLKILAFTLAWSDLGRIAGKPAQHGIYLSVWAGY